MDYTEITLVAPDSAEPGDVVNIQVTIENVSTYPEPHNLDEVIPVLRIDGLVLEGEPVALAPEGPGKTFTWTFQFTMPENSVTITVEAWCESYYVEWHLDKVEKKRIYLPTYGAGCLPMLIIGGAVLLGAGAAIAAVVMT